MYHQWQEGERGPLRFPFGATPTSLCVSCHENGPLMKKVLPCCEARVCLGCFATLLVKPNTTTYKCSICCKIRPLSTICNIEIEDPYATMQQDWVEAKRLVNEWFTSWAFRRIRMYKRDIAVCCSIRTSAETKNAISAVKDNGKKCDHDELISLASSDATAAEKSDLQYE